MYLSTVWCIYIYKSTCTETKGYLRHQIPQCYNPVLHIISKPCYMIRICSIYDECYIIDQIRTQDLYLLSLCSSSLAGLGSLCSCPDVSLANLSHSPCARGDILGRSRQLFSVKKAPRTHCAVPALQRAAARRSQRPAARHGAAFSD